MTDQQEETEYGIKIDFQETIQYCNIALNLKVRC